METLGRQFLDSSRAFLISDYLPKLERCLERLTDEDIWWRPAEWTNSVGNLLLHLNGSTRMWVVGVAGGRPVERDRRSEFDQRRPIPGVELLAALRATLTEVGEILDGLDPASLLERRTRGRREVTVLWAIAHAVEHFSMHTGQIILLAKMRTTEGFDLG